MSKKSKVAASADQLQLTIAAAPSAGLDLRHELRLVKCGLLYADRIELCSPKASMLFAVHGLKNLSVAQQIEFVGAIGPMLQPESADGFQLLGETYKGLARGRNLPKDALLLRARIEGQIRSAWAGLSTAVESMLQDTGVEEVQQLIRARLLTVKVLGQSGDLDDMVGEYVEAVLGALTGASTFPLLDDQTGDLVAAMVREGQADISAGQQERGRHPKLAVDLFERLPAFEQASVGEILDIRKELRDPLVRFRRALMQYAKAMQAAGWDANFASEAEDLFHREVLPTLLEIEEIIRDNRVLKQLAGAAFQRPLQPAGGSAAGLMVAHLSALPEVLALALGLGAGVTAATGAQLAAWRDRKHVAERNDLYFYYRLRKDLGE